MKLFTHKYVITIYENGRFCWKNKGWVKADTDGPFLGFQHTFLMTVIFSVVVILINIFCT